jgi:hypothetical protein
MNLLACPGPGKPAGRLLAFPRAFCRSGRVRPLSPVTCDGSGDGEKWYDVTAVVCVVAGAARAEVAPVPTTRIDPVIAAAIMPACGV